MFLLRLPSNAVVLLVVDAEARGEVGDDDDNVSSRDNFRATATPRNEGMANTNSMHNDHKIMRYHCTNSDG
jgi:hypothetical protein